MTLVQELRLLVEQRESIVGKTGVLKLLDRRIAELVAQLETP